MAETEPVRRQYVTTFTVGVTQQRNARRAIGIVFDGFNLGRNIFFIAFEIDQAIQPLVSTGAMIGGDPAVVVAPAAMFERLAEALFRSPLGHFVESEAGSESYARRSGPVSSYRHW